MTLETLLLALGPDDTEQIKQLAETAINIAGPADATVILGHAFTETEYEHAINELGFDATNGEISPNKVANRHATVRKLSDRLDEASIESAVGSAVGDHGDSIVRMAKESGADMVIVGGRRRSPTGKAVFGSTAQEVMLSAPCPVTFVRADAP